MIKNYLMMNGVVDPITKIGSRRMNERIRELALQAFESNTDPSFVYEADMFVNIFANSIVRECISTVQKRYMGDNNREDMEVLRCVADMKKHFGVKE